MFKDSSRNPAFFLLSVLALTFWIYFPGLQGGFLFDDFPNLKELGTYGGVVDFNSLRAFVIGGFSGPTGRPISLLSFLLNDNTWPSQAFGFKLTNLWIHLLTGLMLCWATLQLLRVYGVDERRAVWVAVISAAIWLLHPYFVSTTLYVVQRMAQLAALFIFAGIAGYLRGRLLLVSRPRAAYIWMTASIGLGTLLAVLSKENGALLPLLIVVVDFCQPKSATPLPAKIWRLVVVWVPALVVVGALASMINFSPDLWPYRPFNQSERLLSEGRILWDYLFHLFVPQIEGRGLFQDGFTISRGWFAPLSTLFAGLALLVLFSFAMLVRKRWPYCGLAVLFFFASHLMESSVVGLELYFEHRNYVAAAFLFLPIALALVSLAEKRSPSMAMLAGAAVFGLLTFMTSQRAALWGDTEKLELYWALSTPESPRAQNSIASYLIKQGRVEEANAHLEKAMFRLPDSALLTIRLLLQKVYTNRATQADFVNASSKLAKQPFDAQALAGLRTLTEFVTGPSSPPIYRQYAIDVVNAMNSNTNFRRISVFWRIVPYLTAQIYLAQGRVDEAADQYAEAMTRYADTEAALMMVAELARGGAQRQALKLLPQAEGIYRVQPRKNLRRSSAEYAHEFARLEADLREDIANKSAAGISK
jgi:tetratricopeptide (TPR) repeat protein